MSVIFFWRGDNYFDNMLASPVNVDDCFLNQNSIHMRDLQRGDHVWAFTRRPDKTYVLAADLLVIDVKENTAGDDAYGRYRAIGDKLGSQYFNVIHGPNAEPIIRSLSFRPKAAVLGHSFQGSNAVRPLTYDDEHDLKQFSSGLKVIRSTTISDRSAWQAMS